jgi:uncharacterized membrane protein YeaQ/YmgE (transglycosylase-associated protein family)
MSILDLVVLLIVAALCGAAGHLLVRYSLGGCITATLVGFVGAVISTWLASSFGLPALFSINVAGRAFPIVWSAIGAAFFVAFLAIFTRGRVTI